MRTGMRPGHRAPLLFAATLVAMAPAASAQVYKWVDERGVVNYSNSAPAAAKNATLVEDRVSVYTPDKALLDAIRSARERRNIPPAREEEPYRSVRIVPVPQPAPVPVYDPCAIIGNPDCVTYAAPVIVARRAARLAQPQIPPGAIAGQVTAGNSFVPGLSTQAPQATSPGATRARSASFTLKPREERPSRWR